MSNKDNNLYVSPLKKAKGLGSAHEGTEHWMMQKITAVTQIPLIIWLICSIAKLQGASYAEFTTWLSYPVHAILMIILVCSVMLHAKLGAQVIVEDYIANEKLRMVKLIGQKILFFAMAIAIIFSILKIALVTEPVEISSPYSVEQRWNKLQSKLADKYIKDGECVCDMAQDSDTDPLQKWRYLQCTNICKAIDEAEIEMPPEAEHRWRVLEEKSSEGFHYSKCGCDMPSEDEQDPEVRWNYLKCINACEIE